jgi:hypothetical protein
LIIQELPAMGCDANHEGRQQYCSVSFSMGSLLRKKASGRFGLKRNFPACKSVALQEFESLYH